MKAQPSFASGSYLKVTAVTQEGNASVSMEGSQITPRGVCAYCTEEEVALLHTRPDDESVAKFQTLLLDLELGFASGEVVQLESEAQVQSVRRVSQKQFEVYMGFNKMMPDGYRHIARYISDNESTSTE